MPESLASHFVDEISAALFLAGIRWPNGATCPHCHSGKRAYRLKYGKKYRCSEPECRRDFTVKVGTVFEASRSPLHKWLLAIYLVNCRDDEKFNTSELSRAIGVSRKTASMLICRVSEVMSTGIFVKSNSPDWIAEKRKWNR